MKVDNIPIDLEILDTPGQKEYQFMIDDYMTEYEKFTKRII